jgi:hypothetical protein
MNLLSQEATAVDGSVEGRPTTTVALLESSIPWQNDGSNSARVREREEHEAMMSG